MLSLHSILKYYFALKWHYYNAADCFGVYYSRRASILYINKNEEKGGREFHYIGKAFMWRFVLDASESGSFVSCQRQSNNRCPRDVILYAHPLI